MKWGRLEFELVFLIVFYVIMYLCNYVFMYLCNYVIYKVVLVIYLDDSLYFHHVLTYLLHCAESFLRS